MSPRERTPEELAEDIADLRADMTQRFDVVGTEVRRLTDRFDAAPYVRKDLHDEQMASVKDKLGGLHTLVMWTLGLLCSAIVGAIMTLLIAVGRGG